jgi:hypothetical protein
MVPSDLSTGTWGLLATSALFIGMAKTGLPGVGSLAIVLMALVIPARQSTGLILPMLIVGDLFAVTYYHRHAVWPHLWRLLPFALPGIVADTGACTIFRNNISPPSSAGPFSSCWFWVSGRTGAGA